ncbi:TPA: hypothetical protein ACOEF8_002041 [Enterobacter roggenkampii]
MAVQTKVIELNRAGAYVMLADGASSTLIQVTSGVLEYVLADEVPPAQTRGHEAATGKELIVTPPTRIYGKAAKSGGCEVVLSPFQS